MSAIYVVTASTSLLQRTQLGQMMMLETVAAARTRDNENDMTDPLRAPPIASLLPAAPKDLYQLWDEYEHGNGGRKAC
jgi:hypothetical protein